MGQTNNKQSLIFIVEDNLAYRVLLARVLEKFGFKVKVFEKAEDAIHGLSECIPALILSDIQLPSMSGFDLQNSVQNLLPLHQIPFVFISSTSSWEVIRKASARGAINMLNKPVSRKVLCDSILEVLGTKAA